MSRSVLRLLIVLAFGSLVLACTFATASPTAPAAPRATATSSPVPPTPVIQIDARVLMQQRPLVWFAPLPPMPTGPGREFIGSEDFMALFEPDAPWQKAASHIQVFKLYGEWVAYHASDEQLREAVAGIIGRGMALAVEAGPLDAPADCGQGIEGFAGKDEGRKIAARIKAAGGNLLLISLDEPYFFAHVYDGPNACRWPAEKIAAEVDEYINVMQAAVPGVIIGDTEPLTGPADAAAYKGWLDTFRRVNGYDLAFMHVDVDWSQTSWPEQVKSIAEYGAQTGVPVGMMYFGNHVDRTDEAWLAAAGERVKKYELEAGAIPEHVLFQSWNDKPDRVLPESQPYTWTNFINAYFTDKTALGYRREGAGANLALGKPVRVSRQFEDQAGALAVDGDLGTLWGAGDFALQWIEVDLGAPYSISQINLTTSQYPVGPTVHRLLVRGPSGEFQLLHTFSGTTDDGAVLTFTPTEVLTGVQVVRVETAQSPSWVAWREIEVVAAE